MRAALSTSILLLACGAAVFAAELHEQTARAYAEYAARARQAFVSRVEGASAADIAGLVANVGDIVHAGPAQGDGISEIPGGLVHHWTGAVFIRGVPLRDVLDVSYAYGDYSKIYRPIVTSRVLQRDGSTFQVAMRMRESAGGVRAVLDVRATVRYTLPSPRTAYSTSSADEIREVRNAGRNDERLLPPGRDSGYLWRADSFTRFAETDGGVYVEMDTVALSRRFPAFLGWVIEPIARRIGRKSVEASLEEFRKAVLARRGQT